MWFKGKVLNLLSLDSQERYNIIELFWKAAGTFYQLRISLSALCTVFRVYFIDLTELELRKQIYFRSMECSFESIITMYSALYLIDSDVFLFYLFLQ